MIVDLIADTIQDKLDSMNVVYVRAAPCIIEILDDDCFYMTYFLDDRVVVYDSNNSVYGKYFYSDPDFYSRTMKRIRMLLKPTPMWHVSGSLTCIPSIIDE